MRAEMGKVPSRAPPSQLNLPPGFRFYPTDEELVIHYLCKKAASEPFSVPIIAEVELYKFDPWDLPEKALFGEKEWFFFSPRDRKYPNGSRPNRAAGAGYWKATGTDKPISTMGGSKKVGVKKALVFYTGKAPKGIKTNWIMHEYRLADSAAKSAQKKGTLRLDDWVLCRIYKKCSSAQKVADVKERSESSCLEEMDGSLNGQEGSYMDKDSMNIQGSNQDTAATYTFRNTSDFSMYIQQLQGRAYGTGIENEQKPSGIRNEHGASSLEVSHLESNGYSSRQLSSPGETSMQDDDAVESTLNSLTALPQLKTYSQSFYGLDTSLLPSPTILGPSFASLLDSDYPFLSTTDYTNSSHQKKAFSHDRNSQLGWDSRVNFST